MEPNQNPVPPQVSTSFFQSNTARLIMVGLLTLILLIPLELVKNLIRERAQRQSEVINEINSKWGEEVFFYGPILKVPYTSYIQSEVFDKSTGKTTTQRTSEQNYAYFFPEELKNNSDVKTQTKQYNNYKSVVFTAQMDFKGKYVKPDFSSKNISDEDIQWDKATIVIRTSNLSSIKDEVSINLSGEKFTFEPIYDTSNSEANSIVSEGKHYPKYININSLETPFIDFKKHFEKGDFSFSLKYDGSSKIRIVPIGKTTETTMKYDWNDTKFTGSFLPFTKDSTSGKLSADWKILHINRPFSQQSFGVLPNISEYSYDVDFIIQVDEYQQNERAAKYGFLTIGLTFLFFFLIQTISKIKIHIFQYTMIGLALIMFYTLLISITEHSSFLKAYLIAGISVIALISLYSISVLKNKKFPLFIALSLSALYSFIFIIIQMENYALLAGSIGLFAILAIVMFVSRKIDWNRN